MNIFGMTIRICNFVIDHKSRGAVSGLSIHISDFRTVDRRSIFQGIRFAALHTPPSIAVHIVVLRDNIARVITSSKRRCLNMASLIARKVGARSGRHSFVISLCNFKIAIGRYCSCVWINNSIVAS